MFVVHLSETLKIWISSAILRQSRRQGAATSLEFKRASALRPYSMWKASLCRPIKAKKASSTSFGQLTMKWGLCEYLHNKGYETRPPRQRFATEGPRATPTKGVLTHCHIVVVLLILHHVSSRDMVVVIAPSGPS